jgi:hypothetical protein
MPPKSMSKNKIKISTTNTTNTIHSDEDKGDLNSKNTPPISKLSESDKEILKVLLSPDNGIKRSSLLLAEKLRIPLTTIQRRKKRRERLSDIIIYTEFRKIWMATCRFTNLYTKWKDRFCSKQTIRK